MLENRILEAIDKEFGPHDVKYGLSKEQVKEFFEKHGLGVPRNVSLKKCPQQCLKTAGLDYIRFYDDIEALGVIGTYYRYVINYKDRTYQRQILVQSLRNQNQLSLIKAERKKVDLVSCPDHVFIYGAGYAGKKLKKMLGNKAEGFIDASEAGQVNPMCDGIPVIHVTEARNKVARDSVVVVTPWWDMDSIQSSMVLECQYMSLPTFIDRFFVD